MITQQLPSPDSHQANSKRASVVFKNVLAFIGKNVNFMYHFGMNSEVCQSVCDEIIKIVKVYKLYAQSHELSINDCEYHILTILRVLAVCSSSNQTQKTEAINFLSKLVVLKLSESNQQVCQ